VINRLRVIFIAVFILIFVVAAFAQKGEEIIKQERLFYDLLKEKKLDLLPDLFMENFHGVGGLRIY